jgi:hypothetical protein
MVNLVLMQLHTAHMAGSMHVDNEALLFATASALLMQFHRATSSAILIVNCLQTSRPPVASPV